MSGCPSRFVMSGDDSRKAPPGIVLVHLAVSAVGPAAAAATGVARLAMVTAIAVMASAMTATSANTRRVGETVIGTGPSRVGARCTHSTTPAAAHSYEH